MTLKFAIDRAPVSTNAAYLRGQGRRLYMSAEAKEFKQALASVALAASIRSGWPKPSLHPCSVSIVVYNTRHDVDGVAKLILDSMEGIVYANDRCITRAEFAREKDATKKPRVEISVTLL